MALLSRPLTSLADLDALLTAAHASTTQQTCRFFAGLERAPHRAFDHAAFAERGLPFLRALALDMPAIFAGVRVPLLPSGRDARVDLSRRQVACLLAHSLLGTITADAVRAAGAKKKWAFRAAQLFMLEANPSTFCFLNYFLRLATHGVPPGSLSFSRRHFARNAPPWTWEHNAAPLCALELHDAGSMHESPAAFHVAFANKFVGGGCLENDFAQEEVLFVTKPELIVAMALCSHMVDEDAIHIAGALQFSAYSGHGPTFEFEGDFVAPEREPATIVEMDALQGCAKIQFQEGLVRRDLNKARIAFAGVTTLSTGGWGTGAFGNDHLLKLLQQWLAASDAGVQKVDYFTFGDKRTDGFGELVAQLRGRTVGDVWRMVQAAASQCAAPGPGNSAKFRAEITAQLQQR